MNCFHNPNRWYGSKNLNPPLIYEISNPRNFAQILQSLFALIGDVNHFYQLSDFCIHPPSGGSGWQNQYWDFVVLKTGTGNYAFHLTSIFE